MTVNFETMSEQQLWALANPIMDNLMDASTQRDHTRHVRDFTERLKGIGTPIAILRRPDSVAILWKQHFTKAPGEFVAEMVLVHRDGRYLVDHVMVF